MARTLAVNALVAGEVGFLFTTRRLHGPARFDYASNPMVWAMIGCILLLQAAFTYLPPLQDVFGTQPLGLPAWGLCLGVALIVCLLAELEKRLTRFRA